MVYDSLTCTYFLHIIAWNDVQKISEVKFLEIYLEVSKYLCVCGQDRLNLAITTRVPEDWVAE